LKETPYVYVIKEINADGAIFLHESNLISHKNIVN